MEKIELSPLQILPAAKYPRVAADFEALHSFLRDVERLLDDMDLDTRNSHRRESRMETRAENIRESILQEKEKIARLTTLLGSTQDPKMRRKYSYELKQAEGKLAEHEYNKDVKDTLSEIIMIKTNLTQELGEAAIVLIREAVVAYLENYVVTGAIGEGTCEFMGKAYVAEPQPETA